MIRINPLDLTFLLLENATRRMHLTAFMIFQKPEGRPSSFGPRLVEAYRKSQAASPFDRRLKWLGKGVAAWKTVEPDMSDHVRHIAIPAPGSMRQCYETISFLNTSLLDRGHPLWECYVIDGIEHDRIAVMVKVHHALIDGERGLRVMRNCLSDSPRDMKGPSDQLHLAGARMVAFHGLPILPPGAGLNVTFASVTKDIGLAIGAAPEAVHEPFRLAQLIENAFRRLQAHAGTTATGSARRVRKAA